MSYTDGMNLLELVHSNPIRFIDPYGLQVDVTIGIAHQRQMEQNESEDDRLDAEQDAGIEQELGKCCECDLIKAKNEVEMCKTEVKNIVGALQSARTRIYQQGGPSRFSFNGPVCTECQQIVDSFVPFKATTYFQYDPVTFRANVFFHVGDHEWGEIKCKATGDYITIDFWKGERRYWRPGQDSFGYKRGELPHFQPTPWM